MGLFSRKKKAEEEQPSPVEVARNINVFKNLARKKTLKMAEEAITKLYKEKRLVFKTDGKVEYTDKRGVGEVQDIDGMAGLIWAKLNDEVVSRLGIAGGSLTLVNITPDDVRGIILKLKEVKS